MDRGLFDPFFDLSNSSLTPRLMDQDSIIINTQVLFHDFYFKSPSSFSMIAPRPFVWLLWAVLPFSTCHHVSFFLRMRYSQFSISLKCLNLSQHEFGSLQTSLRKRWRSCHLVIGTETKKWPHEGIDTPFHSDLYPNPSIPMTRKSSTIKMISILCGVQ